MGWYNAGGWQTCGWGNVAAGGGGGAGTVTFDAMSTHTAANLAGTTDSWTHTPVGAPTAAVVLIDTFSETPSSITYGGVSMTKLAATEVYTGSDRLSIWGLANPPSGAQSIVLTYLTTGEYPTAAAITVTGSDTVTCFRGTGASATGTSTSPSVTCTDALTGDLVVSIAGQDPGAAGGVALTSGGTDRGQINNPGIYADIATASGVASVTFNWTASANAQWGACAAAIKHA